MATSFYNDHELFVFTFQGANASALVKDIGPDQFPPNEHYFGFVNYGNTCYCNSVLQALFFCPPFREKVLSYRSQQHGKKETLLNCLCDLFHNIATQKKKVGVVQPKKFVAKLRKEYELFDNYLQHDAHEFIIFLLNYIGDVLLEEAKVKLEKQRRLALSENKLQANGKKERSGILFNARRKTRTKKETSGSKSSFLNSLKLRTSDSSTPTKNLVNSSSESSVNDKGVPKVLNGYANGTSVISGHSDISTTSLDNDSDASNKKSPGANNTLLNGECNSETSTSSLHQDDPQSFDPKEMATWVHDIFQGTLTNETRCLTCETVSNKDEDFFDLSVDVEQNTSISHCLRGFSNTETLSGEHKYYCEVCCSKQEAQKRMRVKKLPMILTLHLKRFKYMDNLHRYTKLSYRVVFPFELRLFNTSDDATNPDRLYDLIAVVVHCGSGPNRGHYITIVKSHGLWLLFDDDLVEKIDPTTIEDFYGLTGDIEKNSESGYILFYQSKE